MLTESAAILLYLADRFPEAQLAPADRADYYRWLVFQTNTVQTAMLRFFYPERYGGGDKAAAAARDAAEAFDILDRALEGRTWLAAEHRTGADLFLFMLTRWGRRLERPPGTGRTSAATSLPRSSFRECAVCSTSKGWRFRRYEGAFLPSQGCLSPQNGA